MPSDAITCKYFEATIRQCHRLLICLLYPGWSSIFQKDAPFELKKNTLLTTIPSLPREWMVEFEFKPTNFDHSGWTNIFHMTTAPWGTGSLQCSITPEGLFTIISHDNQNGNYQQNFPPPPIGKWTKIRVSQELLDGKFRYRIFILAFILSRLKSYITVSPKKTYHIFP